MSVRRLTDADKRQIVELYRNPGETAATLAEQFGVSNTTIGRILKAGIEVAEYEQLVQQKRRGPDPYSESAPVSESPVEPIPSAPKPVPHPEEQPITGSSDGQRRSRRRTSSPTENTTRETAVETIRPSQAKVTASPIDEFDEDDDELLLTPVTEEVAAILEEDFEVDDAEGDELEDDDDELDEDELDEEEIDLDPSPILTLQTQTRLKVRPFEEAEIPRTCYLVIDRAADLVVRPLEDFGALGLSSGSPGSLTLPIFDNHRVAKRFVTDRSQRVIKVPDSQVFYKTAFQLRAKGITHFFIDGQIYSME